MPRNTWTRERELKLIKLRREGMTLKKIGLELGIAVSSVAQKFNQAGFNHLTDEEHKLYGVQKSLTRLGLSFKQRNS